MKNYPFCEIGLITGTSKSNAVLNIWNTTGVSDCPPEKLAAIEANEGEGSRRLPARERSGSTRGVTGPSTSSGSAWSAASVTLKVSTRLGWVSSGRK